MTEPIIIDGCNVAECTSFQLGNCNNDDTLSIECVKNKNCYFKQLQRLKKENEEILKQLEFSRTYKTVLDAERINYKQALENIKQFLIFADHSSTGDKYFENVEKALNIAREVLNV